MALTNKISFRMGMLQLENASTTLAHCSTFNFTQDLIWHEMPNKEPRKSVAFQETPAGDIMTLRYTHIRVDLRLAKIPWAVKPSHASVLSPPQPIPPPPARPPRSAAAAVWPPRCFRAKKARGSLSHCRERLQKQSVSETSSYNASVKTTLHNISSVPLQPSGNPPTTRRRKRRSVWLFECSRYIPPAIISWIWTVESQILIK